MTDILGWPWRPDLCPADLHYGEYLLEQEPGSITHVGTGLHHHVGLLLAPKGWRVAGLTISRAEVEAWEALTNKPDGYMVCLLDARTIPSEPERGFAADSMSLFHLGEPPAPTEGMLTEREVIERALTWSREVVFYTGSSAWDRIAPLIEDLCADGKMIGTAHYKSLWAYRPIDG